MPVTTSTAVAVAEPVFANAERLALAGFLAGYTGLTRDAYALDLRQYASWCQQHHVRLFDARRADIECFARDLEATGRARATVTRLEDIRGNLTARIAKAEREGWVGETPASMTATSRSWSVPSSMPPGAASSRQSDSRPKVQRMISQRAAPSIRPLATGQPAARKAG